MLSINLGKEQRHGKTADTENVAEKKEDVSHG